MFRNRFVTRLRTTVLPSVVGGLGLESGTLWQGSWMLAAAVLTGGLNYLSNVVVGRMLGPDEYGVFASLVSLLLIVAVLSDAVQTVVTKDIAHIRTTVSMADVGALLLALLKRLLPWAVLGAVVVCLSARLVARFLHLPMTQPIVALGLAFVPLAALPPLFGALAGLQRFAALATAQIVRSAFRLASALSLVSLGLGSTGAVASLFVAHLSAVLLGTWLLRDPLRKGAMGARPEVGALFGDSLPILLALIGFSLLLNSDVVIVKNRFSPTEAGLYSAVATLGKTVLWLTAAVTVLLLPKVVDRHARQQSATGLVQKSLWVTGLLCGALTAVFFLFPEPTVRTFFGTRYLASARLLGPYGLAMSAYSLVNVWLFYFVAVQDRWYGWALMVGVAVQAALLLTLPRTLAAVVLILIGTGCCLFLVGAWRLWRREIREGAA